MKKILLTLSILLGYMPIKAQFVVYDPANFATNLARTLKQAKILETHIEQLIELKRTFEVAKESLGELKKTFELQEAIQIALRQVHTIHDLKWADLDPYIEQALALQETTVGSELPGPLYEILNRKEITAKDAEAFYRQLVDLDSRIPNLPNYQEYKQQSFQVLTNQFAMAEMADKKMLQIALAFNELSNQMRESATELEMALKTDQRFSMTEAERLKSLHYCQEYLQESMDLKSQADQIVQNMLKNQAEVKKQVIWQYNNRLLRDAMAKTPQYKFGK